MMEIVYKVFFFLIILPLTIAQEGYAMLKKYLGKRNILIDWTHVTLTILILLLILLWILGYH